MHRGKQARLYYLRVIAGVNFQERAAGSNITKQAEYSGDPVTVLAVSRPSYVTDVRCKQEAVNSGNKCDIRAGAADRLCPLTSASEAHRRSTYYLGRR